MHQTPRIDKWLWEVRVYKTRSLATEACRSGKVKISDMTVKPSREIKPGEIISIHFGPIHKQLKVIDFPVSRVAAKLVPDYMEDLTSPQEYEKLKLQHETNHEYRPRGIGRPTKKERRLIDRLKNFKHF